MTWELFAAFITAATILILIPGPNVAVIVANSSAYGARYGLITVAGTSSAMALQLACTVLGLTGALSLMAAWFGWLRWLGVGYLVYLGLVAWRTPPVDLRKTKAQPQSEGDRGTDFATRRAHFRAGEAHDGAACREGR